MANAENLNPSSIDSLEEKLIKDFERIKEKLSNPLVYIDSKGEKILITKKGDEICIYKAEDPNRPVSDRKLYLYNVKSRYALIKKKNGGFSLETMTYYNVAGEWISYTKSRDKLDDLNLEQIRECLKNFERRINEAEVSLKNEQEGKDKQNENKYKEMQEYASLTEKRDKEDADRLLDDSYLV